MNMDIDNLRRAYGSGELTPPALLATLECRAEACRDDNIFIYRLSQQELAPYLTRLAQADPTELPLYGIPFAIKDNIDLAGIPTTAACPAFRYVPRESAYVVDRLIEAGAIPVGKTNLDQFATGLNGTRSPYGITPNAFHPDYIAGGSSSGSAVACARGLASFALGTDTAGSGRVPAAFNRLIGVKPSLGLLSTRGVVPACRSLDCVSIFAHNVGDAAEVFARCADYDAQDVYARRGTQLALAPAEFHFGIPDRLEFFGDPAGPGVFADAVHRLERLGGKAVELDFAPFLEAAQLLYAGPWVAERYHAIRELLVQQPEALHPVTRAVIGEAVKFSAVDYFAAAYRLQALKRETAEVMDGLTCIVTPTVGRAYRISELTAEPFRCNSELGHYTNFMNLLDFAAIAVPVAHDAAGVPLGITLFGPAYSDLRLQALAARFAREPLSLCDPEPMTKIVVCGAHMRGLPLNQQLLVRGARFERATRTAPNYRLYALPGGPPPRPGLVAVTQRGRPVEVEEWSIPTAQVGDFLQSIPSPLGVGRVRLIDDSTPLGFLCEAYACAGAQDITEHGGWRRYLEVA